MKRTRGLVMLVEYVFRGYGQMFLCNRVTSGVLFFAVLYAGFAPPRPFEPLGGRDRHGRGPAAGAGAALVKSGCSASTACCWATSGSPCPRCRCSRRPS